MAAGDQMHVPKSPPQTTSLLKVNDHYNIHSVIYIVIQAIVMSKHVCQCVCSMHGQFLL